MNVWVVMGNDYPEAVFFNEEEAEEFVNKKKQAGLGRTPRIYWRTYAFTLDKHVPVSKGEI